MFIDEVEVKFIAGHGGKGKVSFYPGFKSGPDGGNGGRGGDIYLEATSDLTALKQFSAKKTITAENGEAGMNNRKFGKDGFDSLIYLPVGSFLKEKITGEVVELNHPGEKVLICKGGLGGRGNFEFKSPRNTTPEYAQPGLAGEEKQFEIVLKLTADFGLIGLPNAGKSSLLNELTQTEVKVANYPFTTLEPNLGVMDKKVLADIPGLIEGAHTGKGLGIKFLKHIEKVGTLLHCISAESENLEQDYKVVLNELASFNAELATKFQIILLTKSDMVEKKELNKKIKILKKFKHQIFPVSIYDFDSIENLKSLLS